MIVEETSIEGVLLVKPKIFGDQRGFFVEKWNRNRYEEAGMKMAFVQDNLSKSRYGVIRGLHYQKTRPQGKLVSCAMGSILDVVLDIRRDSSTFGKWVTAELTEENQHQLWIPPGLAHGFAVTSEEALFEYKVTEFYFPEDERAIRWNDADLAIPWPIENPTLSQKDSNAPLWREFLDNEG